MRLISLILLSAAAGFAQNAVTIRVNAAEAIGLYDYAADAVRMALPSARVGGPATTGPANEKAANFLRQFLEHCASG